MTPDDDMARMMEKTDGEQEQGVVSKSVQLVIAFPLSVVGVLTRLIVAVANPGSALREITRKRKKRRALAKRARRLIKDRLSLDIRKTEDLAVLRDRLQEARRRQSFVEKIGWEAGELIFDDQARWGRRRSCAGPVRPARRPLPSSPAELLPTHPTHPPTHPPSPAHPGPPRFAPPSAIRAALELIELEEAENAFIFSF